MMKTIQEVVMLDYTVVYSQGHLRVRFYAGRFYVINVAGDVLYSSAEQDDAGMWLRNYLYKKFA